ncbi:MAG: peptide ABC transporter substrate-binding protein [Planctomycetes bacterium]|jgi:peptide/nickel transport system substrate-binding protein|nr:peptide ABC transporter substrate-binding protein [Planctomycetota bacterium]
MLPSLPHPLPSRPGLPMAIGRCVGVAMVLACLLAVGCGASPPSSAPPTNEPTEPVAGGELIVATLADAGRLDPHMVTDAASMRIIENLYSTLLTYGEGYGDFRNDLATSLEISDDQLVYTLELRKGAMFHSGRVVTAEAVKFSLQRIIDKGVRAQHFDVIESIEVVDPHRLTLTLSRPSAPFRSYLAHPMNAIVDPQAVEEADGKLDSTDAGSGPFKLVTWKRDQRIVMTRHDGYHVEGRPYLDRLVFRPITDQTARTTALRTGEVHLVLEVSPKDVMILNKAAGVTVESVPGTFWEYIGLNCAKPPFDDARLRRAVAYGVDRAQLNQLVKFGKATELYGGHIPPNHWAHADLTLFKDKNPGDARFLFDAAGVEEPLPVELIVDSGVSYQVRAAEVIKQQLEPVGFAVTIRGLESSVFFDRLGRGDFEMTVVGWMGFVDPDQWTWNLFHSEGKYNQQGYANAEVDELLGRGRRPLDRAARQEIYAEAQRLIAEEAPMVFLYLNDQASAWRDTVHGYRVHPTATSRALVDTWISDHIGR